MLINHCFPQTWPTHFAIAIRNNHNHTTSRFLGCTVLAHIMYTRPQLSKSKHLKGRIRLSVCQNLFAESERRKYSTCILAKGPRPFAATCTRFPGAEGHADAQCLKCVNIEKTNIKQVYLMKFRPSYCLVKIENSKMSNYNDPPIHSDTGQPVWRSFIICRF